MTDDFDDVLSRLNDTVDQAARGEQQVNELPEVEGVGTAHDERITATVRAGKITDMQIQPLAMRLSNAELAEQVSNAVNDALLDYAGKVTASLMDSQTDFGSLGQATRQIQQDSLKAMKAYTDSLFDALNQVKRNG